MINTNTWQTSDILDYVVFDTTVVSGNDMDTIGFGSIMEIESYLSANDRVLIYTNIGDLHFSAPMTHIKRNHIFLFVDEDHIMHVIGRKGANLRKMVERSVLRNKCNITVKPLSVYKGPINE